MDYGTPSYCQKCGYRDFFFLDVGTHKTGAPLSWHFHKTQLKFNEDHETICPKCGGVMGASKHSKKGK